MKKSNEPTKQEKRNAKQRKYKKTTEGKIAKKRYDQSEKGKDCFKRYKQSKKGKAANKRYQQSKKGKTVALRGNQRFIKHHPNQVKAVKAVYLAIKVGKLPRPNTQICHYCPKAAQQYHHWHGYEKEYWLDVVPVCTQCHIKCKKKIA